MTITSRMYPPTGFAGPCPICGGDCKKPDGEFANRGIHVTEVIRMGPGLQDGPGWKYRSVERVKWVNPATGRYELRYGVGAGIPLIEALRQGVVTLEELTQEMKDALRSHGDRDEVVRVLKGLKRPVADKMVKQDDTVTKGVDGDVG